MFAENISQGEGVGGEYNQTVLNENSQRMNKKKSIFKRIKVSSTVLT